MTAICDVIQSSLGMYMRDAKARLIRAGPSVARQEAGNSHMDAHLNLDFDVLIQRRDGPIQSSLSTRNPAAQSSSRRA